MTIADSAYKPGALLLEAVRRSTAAPEPPSIAGLRLPPGLLAPAHQPGLEGRSGADTSKPARETSLEAAEAEATSQCSTAEGLDEAVRRSDSPGSAAWVEEVQLRSPPRLPSASEETEVQHGLGLCRPCPFVLSGSCEDGELCKFCHICKPGMQELHASGNCRPCIFFQKETGCSSGGGCKFCHLVHDARLLHKRHLRKGRGSRKDMEKRAPAV